MLLTAGKHARVHKGWKTAISNLSRQGYSWEGCNSLQNPDNPRSWR